MTTTPETLRALREELSLCFPERQHVIDGALAAALASEHVFLLGPPGSGKSALVRALAIAFSSTHFERLLTKFSTPEELFGPVSLRALEDDRHERVVAGKLPEAEFVFLDECFNANSAILNSMLSVMNERVFHNGGKPLACPLVTLFGASNQLPEGKDLEALFDRFLLRFDVQYIVQLRNLRDVLLAPEPTSSVRISKETLRAAQAEAASVDVTPETLDALVAIRDSLQAEGIVASDRRWKKSLKLVRASAYLMGERQTSPEDLQILTDSLWREPRERSKVSRIVGQNADPASAKAEEILECARETAKRVTLLKAGDRAAYLTAASKALDEYIEEKQHLQGLSGSAGTRAKRLLVDAQREIQGLHAETTRIVASSLGLGDRVVQAVKQLVT